MSRDSRSYIIYISVLAISFTLTISLTAKTLKTIREYRNGLPRETSCTERSGGH